MTKINSTITTKQKLSSRKLSSCLRWHLQLARSSVLISLHLVSSCNEFSSHLILATALIYWYNLYYKLHDGSASLMRGHHLISNTNHTLDTSPGTPHNLIFNLRKFHFEISPSLETHTPELSGGLLFAVCNDSHHQDINCIRWQKTCGVWLECVRIV